jgi:hypothetical protein
MVVFLDLTGTIQNLFSLVILFIVGSIAQLLILSTVKEFVFVSTK